METSISNCDALKGYDELKRTFTTTDIVRAILKLSGLEDYVWQAQLDEARAKLKQRSDWHLLCVFRSFSELKAAFRLARSKNGRKTQSKC
jgi:hypothetical protein